MRLCLNILNQFPMTRIDSKLFELGLANSRSQAAQLIQRGVVRIDGKTVSKPSVKVTADQKVSVDEGQVYVSRAGYKLEHALQQFGLEVQGAVAIDIGASTGGFSDCLLQRGAALILALDVGTAQLSTSISSNPKVIELSNQNIREFSKEQMLSIDERFERLSLAVCDLSFISMTQALSAISSLAEELDLVGLIKPQFEVGQHSLSASGVVNDWRERKRAIEQVIEAAGKLGFRVAGLEQSPIKGATGNQEYLIWLSKRELNGTEWSEEIDQIARGS